MGGGGGGIEASAEIITKYMVCDYRAVLVSRPQPESGAQAPPPPRVLCSQPLFLRNFLCVLVG